jgi:hypothetical protein
MRRNVTFSCCVNSFSGTFQGFSLRLASSSSASLPASTPHDAEGIDCFADRFGLKERGRLHRPLLLGVGEAVLAGPGDPVVINDGDTDAVHLQQSIHCASVSSGRYGPGKPIGYVAASTRAR